MCRYRLRQQIIKRGRISENPRWPPEWGGDGKSSERTQSRTGAGCYPSVCCRGNGEYSGCLPKYRFFLPASTSREAGAYQDKAVYVENTEAAVEFLEGTKGNILLTTGSKELGKFTALSDAGERIYARVLSLPSVMETCKGYGFEGKHLIGMQGPFSMELNAAMLRQYDCRYLVTKDTGKAGGFQEKIDAALMCDVIPVIIGRPLQEEGLSVAECKHMLTEHFGLTLKPHVTLLGIGMGSEKTLTIQGKRAVQRADLIIGARRMADSIREPGQPVVYEYRSDVIGAYIKSHPEYENIVIALSGDVGFYSGAKKLLDVLNGRKPEGVLADDFKGQEDSEKGEWLCLH